MPYIKTPEGHYRFVEEPEKPKAPPKAEPKPEPAKAMDKKGGKK